MSQENKVSLLEKWAVSEIKKVHHSFSNFIFINKYTVYLFAFVIGVLATLPIVFVDDYINTIYSSSFSNNPVEFMIKWLVILFTIALFSAIEFYLLYKITFIYFVKMRKLYKIKDDDFHETLTFSFYEVMAKIALEIEEGRIHELEADIFRNKNKYFKYFQILLYKIKVFLVNTLIKVILKKLFISNGMRLTIDYMSAIVIGLFDIFIMYLVVRRMKYIFSSIAKINDFFKEKKPVYNIPSLLFQEVLLRVISNIISDTGEYHANYKYIFNFLKVNLGFSVDVKKIVNIGSIEELKEKILLLDEKDKQEAYIFIDFVININRKKSKNLKRFLYNV